MRAGLLGRKLGHSLSPQIHRFFGDYEYRLYEKEPEEIEGFLREQLTGPVAEGRDSTVGLDFLNVTIPYKQTVFALCDELSPMARKLGNVNFVTRTADGKLRGDNTDAFGVERLLAANGIDVLGWNCAILGAGGAAMTVKAVLEERGAKRVTFVRRGEEPSRDDDLIVNATPVGMFPDVDGVRVDISRYARCKAVLDLVYNPSPTRLVREARACGKIAADGMVMLIAQAYEAARLGGLEGSGGAKVDGIQSLPNLPNIPNFQNLFLYGPPASGKSTWAKRIAAATGRTLVDLDAEIVKAEELSIPEIFAKEGEKGFRAIEKMCLSSVCGDETSPPQSGRVVALGGGALLDPESRKIAEAAGRSIPEIFEKEGEKAFREIEKRSLEKVIGGGDGGDVAATQVIALGGGALLDPESRRLAEANGRVVVLDCPLETLKARLTGGDRPLSADAEKLEALVRTRSAHYASFPRRVKMV